MNEGASVATAKVNVFWGEKMELMWEGNLQK